MAKVLVVDDSPAVRLAMAEVIGDLGHTVVQCENGGEAIACLADCVFDLVVTDVLMPEKDGLEVIKAIRRSGVATRVLAVSGGAPNLPAGYALKMTEMFAADAVLYKPFRNDELCRIVTDLVGTGRG